MCFNRCSHLSAFCSPRLPSSFKTHRQASCRRGTTDTSDVSKNHRAPLRVATCCIHRHQQRPGQVVSRLVCAKTAACHITTSDTLHPPSPVKQYFPWSGNTKAEPVPEVPRCMPRAVNDSHLGSLQWMEVGVPFRGSNQVLIILPYRAPSIQQCACLLPLILDPSGRTLPF